MNPRLAEAWVNRDDHVVCGRRLHPYCMYDAMFLSIDQNPIFLRHRDIEFADLLSAVRICSSEPANLLAAKSMLRGPLKTLRLALWARRWRSHFKEEMEKFMSYVTDFESGPKFWKGAAGGAVKAPWIMSLLSFVEDHSNMTTQEIMTAPLGLMLWRSASIAEQLGVTANEIVTDEEEEAMAAMGIEI